MDHTLRGEHLPWSRQGTQPGSQVQRSPSITTLDGHRLTRIQADAGAQRQGGILLGPLSQLLLHIQGCSQRSSRRCKPGQHLISSYLDHLSAPASHHLAHQLRKPGRQSGGGLIAAGVGKGGVTPNVGHQERLHRTRGTRSRTAAPSDGSLERGSIIV